MKKTTRSCRLLFFAIATLAGSLATSSTTIAATDPLDWSNWRGPELNGVSRETGLVDDIDLDEGSEMIEWKRDDLGGRSTPIVMNGKLYTIVRAEPDTDREGEKVVCVDAVTGKTIWENRFNVWLSDVPAERVGWSSVVGDPDTGYVYALGVCGFFQCLNGETGERIWSLPLHEQFGLLSTYGGRTNFPIICDDLVIISAIIIGWGDMAKPAHRFIGFDKKTGEVVWYNGTSLLPDDTTYSSPALAVLNGQKAMVFGSGDGQVWAFQPRTGQPIWRYDFSLRGLNVSPVIVGETVYMGHSEENIGGSTAMGAVAAINGASQGDISKSGELWKVEELMIGKSSPLVIGDYLYCFDDRAKLHVLDAKTGEPIGRPISLGGTSLRACPLYADGKIYAFSTSAWAILQPDEKKGATILKRGRLANGEEVNASPICSHGRIYLQTSSATYSLRDKSKEQDADPLPDPVAEASVSEDQQPAHLQLVPAELLTKPGAEQKYRVRLYNSHGQFLKESPATFALNGPGTIGEDGVFRAAADAPHTATIITATVGDLTGRARVRVIPDLPWKFDFEGLSDLPVTWVGARYRHVIRKEGDNTMAVKVTTIPKGTRSRCWFGPSDLHDYTIQADVRGLIAFDKMPDIGLTAQGYALDMQGASQKLQIRSWAPQLRMDKTIDFAWQPNVWYVMKLQASNEESRTVLRGKVWPRGEDEPAEWTITATDEAPNLSGSPGLFGNAKDAEIHIDNILVTAN
ncbi:MAG: PQQ-binding-like beta-propeller repeat protein [Planctomycetales bacterium]|nr:PQQ-binding-like beta-propeller repeat protein [Planctomycetales bacterium]